MKYRQGFVTNSSSSSFILTNTSNKTLSNIKVSKALKIELERLQRQGYFSYEMTVDDIKSSSPTFRLKPGEQIEINCGDHSEDGLFENIIHFEDGVYKDDFNIVFEKSHH